MQNPEGPPRIRLASAVNGDPEQNEGDLDVGGLPSIVPFDHIPAREDSPDLGKP